MWTHDLDQVVVLVDLEVCEPGLVHAPPRLPVGGCVRPPSISNQGDDRRKRLVMDVPKSLVLRQFNLSARELPSEQALLLGSDVVGYGTTHGLLGPLEPLALDLLYPSLQGRCVPSGLGFVAREVASQFRLQRLDVSDGERLRLPLPFDGLLDEVRRQVALATDTATSNP